MLKEGYQPNKGKLDVSNPPQGGSGIPDKENIYKKMWESLKTPDWCLGCNLRGIREVVKKLIIRYEKELKEGDYSIVDGSNELERVIKDLKKIIK